MCGLCLSSGSNEVSSSNFTSKKGKAGRVRKTKDEPCTILLIGPGDSGKSTIFKQLKKIYSNGFTEEERKSYADVIRANMLKGLKYILFRSSELGHPIDRSLDKEIKIVLAAFESQELSMLRGKSWEKEVSEAIKSLWQSQSLQKAFSNRSEYQVDESTEYFFKNLDRIEKDNYIPTEEDIFNVRIKTTGIVENEFKMKGKKIKIIDVGGQRNERKKWIHCFEGVTVVIFVASLSEFDQKLYEDNSTNRMDESLKLFDEILNSRWFESQPFMLFLNKSDLFKDKLKNSEAVKKFFPQECTDYESCLDFMRLSYLSMNKKKKQIFCHVTCACDTNNVQKVFDSLQSVVFSTALKKIGIM